ncbi:OmpA family protein [bacterium]|nr:OmpA family protein [bacterium]
MKKVSCLAIVGIFILSVALTGCGNLKKKEFDQVFTEHKGEQEQIHTDINTKVTGVDQKLDQEVSDRKAGVDEAKKAANDAMAAAEQGDADTLDAAKSEDDKVRQDAKQLAQEAEDSAKKFAQAEDEKVRQQAAKDAREAMNRANSAAGAANKASDVVNNLRGVVEKIKPVTVAVVQFRSGQSALTKEAKAELDKAVDALGKYGDDPIIVKGHADGTPVLSGKYQSNWDLSEARAKAVMKYLQGKGVDNPMGAVARAHTEPKSPAFTAKGRTQNRRAEVIVYPSGVVE